MRIHEEFPTTARRIAAWWRIGLAIAFASLIVEQSATAADKPAGRPNVVVIVADDLGYGDLGVHGGKDVPTPNIDSLAKQGVRCTDGYVSCPVCSPTRAGLITGRYQQRFGHEFNPGRGRRLGEGGEFGLPLDQVTIANVLKDSGYKTGIVGKWHLGWAPQYQPEKRGFDEFFGFLGGAHAYFPGEDAERGPIQRGSEVVDEKEYLTDAIAREAVAFVDRHKSEPFFLYLTFNAVHNPSEATDKYLSRVAHISEGKRKTYLAMLSALDDGVGQVLQALDRHQLGENTLIFFVSDNGGPQQGNGSNNRPLNGDKGTVYEGGIRVPYLVRWKGHLEAGKVYSQPVISLDILPTVAAATGSKLPEGVALDGVNLLPFLTGETAGQPHESLLWRFGPQHAIRRGNYKLLKLRSGERQLFDLASDLGEKHDLAGEKPEVARELAAIYDAWSAELAQPRWEPQQPQRNRQRRTTAAN